MGNGCFFETENGKNFLLTMLENVVTICIFLVKLRKLHTFHNKAIDNFCMWEYNEGEKKEVYRWN